MTKDEALTLALEALKSGVKTQANRIAWIEYDSCLIKEAITAIKEALAQPNSVHDYGPLCEDIAAWTQRRKSNAEKRNFCPRCGKRTADLAAIHTCTPPKSINWVDHEPT